MTVPVLPQLDIPLPDPALPGLEGTLIACDIREMPTAMRDEVAARIFADWESQLGDPTEQPENDADALGIGVVHNGEVIAWGALHSVTVTEVGPGSWHVEGTMLAESGIPGLGATIADLANGAPLEGDGYSVALLVLA